MKRFTAILALLLAVSLATASLAAAEAKIDGAALLEERCSVCHKSERPKSAKKTKADWEKTVARMIGKGAQLSTDEKAILVDHLARNYKP
jgi:cytochrome c5